MRKFLCLIALVSLTACGGGGAENMNINANTTIGQELTDLREAFDEGIITEREYERTKADILERYDQ
ncbi:MAG: hypothetical protein Alpg2KO_00340 [Alphaproteobacteria bacterium]